MESVLLGHLHFMVIQAPSTSQVTELRSRNISTPDVKPCLLAQWPQAQAWLPAPGSGPSLLAELRNESYITSLVSASVPSSVGRDSDESYLLVFLSLLP